MFFPVSGPCGQYFAGERHRVPDPDGPVNEELPIAIENVDGKTDSRENPQKRMHPV